MAQKTRPTRERYKQIVDYHINEETITESSFPVDYSFFKFKELQPIECEKARITRLGDTPERGKENKKYLTRGVWLNNNKLTGIRGLDTLVEAVLEFPERLAWIDLSYNYIKKIDEVILQFPNLTILNFHGNRISDITEVAKLRRLKKLRNITFHGNPIASQRDYRLVIIAYLPTIVHLDFQPILKSERLQPVHPEALKYLKSLKLEGGREEMTTSSKTEGPTTQQKEGGREEVTTSSKTEGPTTQQKEEAQQRTSPVAVTRETQKIGGPPRREAFTSNGPCACVLNRRLYQNTHLE